MKQQMKPKKTAYLIVVCDRTTNAVLYATIWSSPEWEQSMCLKHRTYVAYMAHGVTFDDARKIVIERMKQPQSRYCWLLPHFERHTKEEL